mgnify:CR=1 FL=1
MSTSADQSEIKSIFKHSSYLVRTKLFRIFGGAFHIYNGNGELVLYSEQKRFKIKEDIRLYSDETQKQELLRISTQSIFDITGAYDVKDSITEEHIGTLKRSGLRSTFLRDYWEIVDPAGEKMGHLQEDSIFKALVRRFIENASFLLPQKYHISIRDKVVGTYKQRFNPIILKLDVNFSLDERNQLDRRLGLAGAVLMCVVEGRQQ